VGTVGWGRAGARRSQLSGPEGGFVELELGVSSLAFPGVDADKAEVLPDGVLAHEWVFWLMSWCFGS